MEPSTCGLIFAESRDLSETTYSDESVIGCELTASTFTIIAGGGPCGPCGFPLHAVRMPAIASISGRARFKHPRRTRNPRGAIAIVIISGETFFDSKRRIVLAKVIHLRMIFSCIK